jgi:hypothetical protein
VKAAEEFAQASDWYRRFAEVEAPGSSAIYEEWAWGVAADEEVLALITELPRPKRQPNLIFACSRLLGAPVGAYQPWRNWLVANWEAVKAEALLRATQTNEPGRCAVLLPVLAMIEGPIALLEIGASAGLCLYPDRYSYSYDGDSAGEVRLDPTDGPSSVLLQCAVTGAPPLPTRMPDIAWRAGLDLNPLDVSSADDVTWLETLIWPEQDARRERLRAAMEIARADPPTIVRGDALDALPGLVAQAPARATLVVVTSAAIVYLMPEPRAELIRYLESSRARWISNEGAGIVPKAKERLEGREAPVPGELLLSLDQNPLAFAGGHGQRLDWLT